MRRTVFAFSLGCMQQGWPVGLTVNAWTGLPFAELPQNRMMCFTDLHITDLHMRQNCSMLKQRVRYVHCSSQWVFHGFSKALHIQACSTGERTTEQCPPSALPGLQQPQPAWQGALECTKSFAEEVLPSY